MSLSTPVVFAIFNRPDTTEQVFQAIRQVQPQRLLVIADGARVDRPNEAAKCAATRAIIDRVDWECEVLTNYSDTNLGCKQRISSGLDWAFSQVEEAIILEDDCLPSPSFFNFCQTLLEKYRDDQRVIHIGGNNFQCGQSRTEYSYYFSKYSHIWGWASWQRAWKHYDLEMKTWSEFKDSMIMDSVHYDIYERRYWQDIFDQVDQGLIDSWAYLWTYTCWIQGGLSIVPDVNLVTNIGFGSDATHTVVINKLANLPTVAIDQISDPPFLIKHQIADAHTFHYVFGGKAMKDADTVRGKLNIRAKNLKRRIKYLLN
jgi:hypothetical protein